MQAPRKDTYSVSLRAIDGFIKEGNLPAAEKALKLISPKKIPRALAVPFAACARRLGQNLFAIKTLNPIVRPALEQEPPTFEELGEYALNLMRIGAKQEAGQLLTAMPAEKYPKALMYLGFFHILQWNYEKAAGYLEKFIQRADAIDDYELLSARANLAAALIVCRRHDEAEELLLELNKIALNQSLARLQRSIQELRAQNEFIKGNFQAAHRHLMEASPESMKPDPSMKLFLQKWRALIALKTDHHKKDAVQNLHLVKDKALELGHWETLRDCDRYLALETKNRELLLKVYFGTPHVSFRQTLADEWGEKLKLPDEYFCYPNKKGASLILDIPFGQVVGQKAQLKAGQTMHRLLQALTSDFYQPLPLGELFNQCYPGENFDPYSSPARIHRVIQRLRRWFKAVKFPMQIAEARGSYRLVTRANCGLRVTLREEQRATDPAEVLVNQFRKRWKEKSFRLKDFATALELSASHAQRAISRAKSLKLVKETGRGKKTIYSLS